MSIFNSLSGKVKEKKDQKLLEKKEKYYRSEILPEIRKIVQGEFVTSKIGITNKINKKNCALSKDDLIRICDNLTRGFLELNEILKPLANALDNFLMTDEGIQQSYINYVLVGKNNRNNFYYNEDKYLIDVFKTCYPVRKYDSASQALSKYLSQKSIEQLVDCINIELSHIISAEEMLMKIFQLPKTTLAYVCAVKHMENRFDLNS